jgi:predicted esterase
MGKLAGQLTMKYTEGFTRKNFSPLIRYRSLSIFLILALLVPVYSCFGQDAGSEGQVLVRRYLESTDVEERENILESLKTVKAGPKKIKEWITSSANYAPQQLGLQRDLVSVGERKGEYFVYIPSNYVPDKSWPMILALHGVGGRGYDSVMAWLRLPAHNDEFIFIAPTYGSGLWWKDEAEHLVLSVLNKVKRNYNIDTNRVYLTGFSSGAHGTWYMALRYPDLFAAINPIAGECPIPSLLVNLLHVPVYVIHGAQDTVIPVEAARDAVSRLEGLNDNVLYTELPDMKHRFPVTEGEQILNWFRAHKRSLYPKEIRFSTESGRYTTSYWIEILEFSELVGQISRVQKDISGHLIRPEGFPVTAGIDANIKDTDNEICLRVTDIKAVRLYLDDELIDMERPLRVSINGKVVYFGKVESDVRSVLDTVKKRSDRNALFSGHLDLRVPTE